MERQVDHMVRLIDDLLDVSRIVNGKIELRKECVDLASVIPRAIEMIQPMIDSAGHRFHASLPAKPIILHADSVRIAQIIGNLLNNAVKYTPTGGQIWLTAREDGQQATISVRDTGAGIPVEMLPRVFEMFTQVDRTLTRSQGGLGIGLTLTKSLVEMHGGQIQAYSEGLDQGSEFIITLPIMIESQSESKDSSLPAPNPSAPLIAREILIVDDAPSASFVLGKLLERLGQRPHIVASGQAALDRIQVSIPDMVISDIAMPHMDGFELARRLRQDPCMNNCTLVALTGYGQDRDRQLTNEAGFDRHLVKPVSLDSLEQLLRSLSAPTRSCPKDSA